jgi:hypothetical protein
MWSLLPTLMVHAVSSVRPNIRKELGDLASHFLHPDRSAQDVASPMEPVGQRNKANRI